MHSLRQLASREGWHCELSPLEAFLAPTNLEAFHVVVAKFNLAVTAIAIVGIVFAEVE